MRKNIAVGSLFVLLVFVFGVLTFPSREATPPAEVCVFGNLVRKGPLQLCAPNVVYTDLIQQLYVEIRSPNWDSVTLVKPDSSDGRVSGFVEASVRENGDPCPTAVRCYRFYLWAPKHPGMMSISVTASLKGATVDLSMPMQVTQGETRTNYSFWMYPAPSNLYVNGSQTIFFEYAASNLNWDSRPALNIIVRNGIHENSGFSDTRADGTRCPQAMRCGFLRVRSKGKPGVIRVKVRMYESSKDSNPTAVASSLIRVIPDDFDD